jgi:hypothetical protein
MIQRRQTSIETATLKSKNLSVELDIRPPLNRIKGNIVGMEMGTPPNLSIVKGRNPKEQLIGYTAFSSQDYGFSELHKARRVIKNRPNLQPCLSCHLLGASFYSARNAATLFHICDLPSGSNRVCRGLDAEGFQQETGDVLHNVLFDTRVRLTPELRDAIRSYADDCIGRDHPERCEYDLIPLQDFPNVAATKAGKHSIDRVSRRAVDEEALDANFHSPAPRR